MFSKCQKCGHARDANICKQENFQQLANAITVKKRKRSSRSCPMLVSLTRLIVHLWSSEPPLTFTMGPAHPSPMYVLHCPTHTLPIQTTNAPILPRRGPANPPYAKFGPHNHISLLIFLLLKDQQYPKDPHKFCNPLGTLPWHLQNALHTLDGISSVR